MFYSAFCARNPPGLLIDIKREWPGSVYQNRINVK